MKNITLDRDHRYTAAHTRHTELQHELSGLEQSVTTAYCGLSSLSESRDLIRDEAAALLEGASVIPTADRAAVLRTIDDLNHRIAVLRQAVDMQRGIVNRLRGEVGNAIAAELLPQHLANVKAIVDAAIQLSVALQAEQGLRDTLIERDVPFTAVLRAMPLPGFNLRDDQSRLSRYLVECYEQGFVKAGDLPDVVRDRLPRKVKPQPRIAAHAANGDGWMAA